MFKREKMAPEKHVFKLGTFSPGEEAGPFSEGVNYNKMLSLLKMRKNLT